MVNWNGERWVWRFVRNLKAVVTTLQADDLA
jgi:hypothetical protein